jgi:streptogramin lyase
VAAPILAVAQPGQLLQAAASPDPCTGWTTRTIVSGLGVLEDIEPDRTGGMLLAASSQNAVERLRPDGTTTTVATGLSGPGGERVVGGILFVNTGDSLASGTTETHDGTIQRIDLSTGARTTYASGLVMPNGLVLGPDGAAYTTRDDLNTDSAITRVDSSDPAHPNLSWAKLGDTNGVSIDPTGTWLYADITFQAQSDVYRIRISNPTDIELVASLADVGVPAVKGLDDLTIDALGVLYITANGSGEVIRLDPATGAHCVIVSGLQNPSALKFGHGPGWTSSHLYLVGFDGAVRELTPPAGVSPQPEPDLLTVPPGGGPIVPDLQPALATAAIALAILAAALLRRRSEPDA